MSQRRGSKWVIGGRLPVGPTRGNERTAAIRKHHEQQQSAARFMVPITCNERPSNGCRSRSIVTELEMSRRWVVCDGFLRPGEPRHPDGAGGQAGGRQAPAEADPRLPERGGDGGRAGQPEREGTPQGGPLSPLLSNLVLDDVDKELESRGHRFCATPTTATSMCAAGGRASG